LFFFNSPPDVDFRIANVQRKLHCAGITSEDVRKSDLLAELTGLLSDGVAQDLWILLSASIITLGANTS